MENCLPAAIAAAAAAVPLCQPCVDDAGLCVSHVRDVTPQLKEPAWYRDAHSGMYHETGKTSESPEARRIRERKERKRARVAKLVAGGFAPVRSSRAA